jgi:hypothetical protein
MKTLVLPSSEFQSLVETLVLPFSDFRSFSMWSRLCAGVSYGDGTFFLLSYVCQLRF